VVEVGAGVLFVLGVKAPAVRNFGVSQRQTLVSCGVDHVNKLPELFVHRNVANLVLHNDFSCLSVLQYAIEVLGIEHVIVCGHYGCGGVTAAWDQRSLGLVDNWLQPIRDIAHLYREPLFRLPGDEQRIDRLCELNVLFQARRVCRTTIVQQAWDSGKSLTVHAWVYRLGDGLLRDLGFCASDGESAEGDFARAAGVGTIGDEDARHSPTA